MPSYDGRYAVGTAKARAAYQDFLTQLKDDNISILKQIKVHIALESGSAF